MKRHFLWGPISVLLLISSLPVAARETGPVVPNPGFEVDSDADGVPDGWSFGTSGGARAEVVSATGVAHSGKVSVRISNASPFKAFVYASLASEPIPVTPNTTYVARFFARGKDVRKFFLAVSFEGKGEKRLYIDEGNFGWKEFANEFTTPESCDSVRLVFISEDVTGSVWIDDVSVEISAVQRTNLTEVREPKSFPGVFPRPPEPPARHLFLFDTRSLPDDREMAAAALQGIVNRKRPRLYLLNRTNPPGMDLEWLEYMKEKDYTGEEKPVGGMEELIDLFRDETTGAIVYDENLPGSIHAACMLAGLDNALPLTASLADEYGLPVIEDLRGRWTRNVDAYRFVFDNHWDRMNHHILAWYYPEMDGQYARDYLVQNNIFTFWVSKRGDVMAGADPAAEEEFVHELFAATPGNVPVLGWPNYADVHGIQEYSGVRWCSEYGKFVPGTVFCSNLSVHSAIHPPDEVFSGGPHQGRESKKGSAGNGFITGKQVGIRHSRAGGNPDRRVSHPPVELEKDKICVAVNILESGDSIWYWQLYQRKVWDDPARGSVPIGWSTNITMYDAAPLVLEWYYEHATPNDRFFAALSGLGYMNTQTYASRFRAEDRERIWDEYVRLTGEYCRRLGIHGIELYNGSWGERTPPNEKVFRRFAGIEGIDFILADLGRHEMINPSNANYLLDGVPVFHTLTRFRVWSSSTEVTKQDRDESIDWLVNEIIANSPEDRPGFMSAMAISWYFFPSWIKELKERLPEEYLLVGPDDLASLFLEWKTGVGLQGSSGGGMDRPDSPR